MTGITNEQRTNAPGGGRAVPKGAHYVPVTVLDPPSLVQNVLDRLDVVTVGDLLSLSDEQLKQARGVGAKKIEVINELKERALSELRFDEHGLSEASETQLLSDRLENRGIELDERWERVLRVLPTRARGAFESVGFGSLRELVQAFERGELRELPNFGPKTLRKVEEILERIAVHGLEDYIYGQAGAPTTISQLVDQALAVLDDDDRQIVERRFFQGHTFGEIGDDFGVSFQAIQARFDSLVEQLRFRFGPEAELLVEPILAYVDGCEGLVGHGEVMDRAEADNLREVLFALQLAGESEFRIWQDRFVTRLSTDELEQRLKALRDKIVETGRAVVAYERIEEFGRAVGLHLSRADMRALFEAVWHVDLPLEGPVPNPWARRSDHIANLLEDARRPLSADQIHDLLEDSEASEAGVEGLDEISERALNGLLHRHEDIYTIERGSYVHVSALPIEPEALDQIVEWCVDRLRGETGQISTKFLLREMADTSLPIDGLTPYLLKDALSRHPKVLTFKNTYLVAHTDSFEDRGMTLADRVEAVLAEASEPLTVEDVIERLAEAIDYHRMSIYTTLLSAPFSVNLGNNRFVHVNYVGLNEKRRERLRDEVYETLPADGTPMSCTDLLDKLDKLPEARSLKIRPHGAGLLWGMLRDDARIVCGPGELVARDDGSDDQHVLRTAIGQIIDDHGAAYPREVRAELRNQFGYRGSDSAVFGSLTRGAEEGALLRFPESLYTRNTDDDSVLEALSMRDREVRRLADSNELDQAPPRVRELLAKYYRRHGHQGALDRLDRATS